MLMALLLLPGVLSLESYEKLKKKKGKYKPTYVFQTQLFNTGIPGECNCFSGQNIMNIPLGGKYSPEAELRESFGNTYFCFPFSIECFQFLHLQEMRFRFLLFFWKENITQTHIGCHQILMCWSESLAPSNGIQLSPELVSRA